MPVELNSSFALTDCGGAVGTAAINWELCDSLSCKWMIFYWSHKVFVYSACDASLSARITFRCERQLGQAAGW